MGNGRWKMVMGEDEHLRVSDGVWAYGEGRVSKSMGLLFIW